MSFQDHASDQAQARHLRIVRDPNIHDAPKCSLSQHGIMISLYTSPSQDYLSQNNSIESSKQKSHYSLSSNHTNSPSNQNNQPCRTQQQPSSAAPSSKPTTPQIALSDPSPQPAISSHRPPPPPTTPPNPTRKTTSHPPTSPQAPNKQGKPHLPPKTNNPPLRNTPHHTIRTLILPNSRIRSRRLIARRGLGMLRAVCRGARRGWVIGVISSDGVGRVGEGGWRMD